MFIFGKVWRPMRAAITGGQSTDLEAKMRLKEAKMIEGPSASTLYRGRSYQEFISKIIRYSMGWSDLQWTSKSVYPAPTHISLPWHDGTRPLVDNFMGESGGCMYTVYSPTGLGYSQLAILRPSSERTGRKLPGYFTMKIDFIICAVAIDSILENVVLLQRSFLISHIIKATDCADCDRRPNGNDHDALLHFYGFAGNVLRAPYLWHPTWWYDLTIRQFETVDGMLGILTAPSTHALVCVHLLFACR
jgi:hypothetical protein